MDGNVSRSKAKLLNLIGREHIQSAFKAIDSGKLHGFSDSTHYDVVYDGKRYPPKAVVGVAAEIATKEPFGPKDFKGGEDSKCFRVLSKAGFEIARKPRVAWILQGNPKDFPVEEHIKGLGFRYWTFPKFRDDVRTGDDVYIYKCGPGAAIIGKGVVKELPTERKNVKQPEIIGTRGTGRENIEGPDTLKVGIEVTEQRVGNPNGQILREEMLKHPVLKTCTIMTSKQGSNFRIFENQRHAIETLWDERAGAQSNQQAPLQNQSKRNVPWTRDELLLALELYLKNPKTPPEKHTEEIKQFSGMLNKLGNLLGVQTKDKYRNENGVYMKLMNFRRLDPQFKSSGAVGLKAGNKDEKVVWETFAHNPEKLKQACDAIRTFIANGEHGSTQTEWLDDDSDTEAEEGRLLTRQHRVRERNKQISKKKKQDVLRKHGQLACEVCGFVYEKRYGQRGRGFIECHHTKPVSTLSDGHKTTLEDLAVVCANCHRMIHSAKPWLSIPDLKKILLG